MMSEKQGCRYSVEELITPIPKIRGPNCPQSGFRLCQDRDVLPVKCQVLAGETAALKPELNREMDKHLRLKSRGSLRLRVF